MDQTKRLISVFDCHQWYTVKNSSFCYCGRAWFSSLIVPERLSVVLFLWAVVYSFVSMFPRSSWVCFIPLFIEFEVLVFIILFHATGNRIYIFFLLILFVIKGSYQFDGFDLMDSNLWTIHAFIDCFLPTITFSKWRLLFLHSLYLTILYLNLFDPALVLCVKFKHFQLKSVPKLTWERPLLKSIF